jgi:hypothetical protein
VDLANHQDVSARRLIDEFLALWKVLVWCLGCRLVGMRGSIDVIVEQEESGFVYMATLGNPSTWLRLIRCEHPVNRVRLDGRT